MEVGELYALGFSFSCPEVLGRLELLIRFGLGPMSYAAGTPGGLFAPMLVLGAQSGLALGTFFCRWFPDLAQRPAAFAIVGMAAFFTGVVRAPVTGIILVTEMTGGSANGGQAKYRGGAFADSLFVMFVNESALVPTVRPSMLSDHQTLEIWNPRTFSIFGIFALSSLSDLSLSYFWATSKPRNLHAISSADFVSSRPERLMRLSSISRMMFTSVEIIQCDGILGHRHAQVRLCLVSSPLI